MIINDFSRHTELRFLAFLVFLRMPYTTRRNIIYQNVMQCSAAGATFSAISHQPRMYNTMVIYLYISRGFTFGIRNECVKDRISKTRIHQLW